MFDQNKEICRRLLEDAYGKGNLKTLDETLSTGCRLHDPVFPTLQPGPDSLKQHIRNLREAFPDMSCACDDIIAERDEVVIHWTSRGTHRGKFLNCEATNRSIMVSGTTIHRLERGKIVEMWVDWNLQTLLDQIGAGMTGQEDNKALAKRFIEDIWNKQKPSMINYFVTDNYVRHSPSGFLRGAEGLRQDFDTYISAFPDCHIRIDQITSEGDTVAVRFTATGRQTGKLMDTPASGKAVSVPGISLIRIVNGKIAEEHVVWDRLGMLQQLSAPATKAKSAKTAKK